MSPSAPSSNVVFNQEASSQRRRRLERGSGAADRLWDRLDRRRELLDGRAPAVQGARADARRSRSADSSRPRAHARQLSRAARCVRICRRPTTSASTRSCISRTATCRWDRIARRARPCVARIVRRPFTRRPASERSDHQSAGAERRLPLFIQSSSSSNVFRPTCPSCTSKSYIRACSKQSKKRDPSSVCAGCSRYARNPARSSNSRIAA